MKIAQLIFLAAIEWVLGGILSHAAADSPPPLTVLERNRPVVIVTPREPTSVEQFAAIELSKYLELSLGVQATVTTSAPAGEKGIVFYLGTFDATESKWQKFLPTELQKAAAGASALIEDGILIHAENGEVLLAGKGSRGALNATYAFLEDVVGCRWPEPGRESIPKLDNLPLKHLEIASNPAFKYRGIALHGRCSRIWFLGLIDWMGKNRLNAFQVFPGEVKPAINAFIANYKSFRKDVLNDVLKRGLFPNVGAHSLDFFFLGKGYQKDHPEYFAKVNGHPDGSQICYSNLDSVPLYAANVVEYLKSRPEIKMVGLWPSDGFTTCQCERCKKAFVTDLRLRYTNALMAKINESIPGVKGEYLAYIDYVAPPKDEKPAANLTPTYCEYVTRSQLHPITESVSKHDAHRRNIEAWIKASKEVTIFSYYGDDCIKAFMYRPVMDVVIADLRYYHRVGLAGNFVLLTDSEQWWSNAPHMYAYAKAAWNPDVKLASVESDYYRATYGPAAEAMQAHGKACRDFSAETVKGCLAKARRLATDPWAWDRIRRLEVDAEFVELCREAPHWNSVLPTLTPKARAAIVDRVERAMAGDVLREARRGYASASNHLQSLYAAFGIAVAETEDELYNLKKQRGKDVR